MKFTDILKASRLRNFVRGAIAAGHGDRPINRALLLRAELGVPVVDIFHVARPKTDKIRARRARRAQVKQ